MDIIRTIVALQWAVDNLNWADTDEERQHLKLVKAVRDHLLRGATLAEPSPNVSPLRPTGREVIRR